jgi:hypothetical protein
MSLDAGKALLADDNWGGCRVVDDGFHSDDDENEDEVVKRPRQVKSVLFISLSLSSPLIFMIKKPPPYSKTNPIGHCPPVTNSRSQCVS